MTKWHTHPRRLFSILHHIQEHLNLSTSCHRPSIDIQWKCQTLLKFQSRRCPSWKRWNGNIINIQARRNNQSSKRLVCVFIQKWVSFNFISVWMRMYSIYLRSFLVPRSFLLILNAKKKRKKTWWNKKSPSEVRLLSTTSADTRERIKSLWKSGTKHQNDNDNYQFQL